MLVGDLMQDLAARVGREVVDEASLQQVGRDLAVALPGLALEPGGYLFATIHRADNREPDAIRAWSALLNRVANPARPVILAIHPGTRVALEAAGTMVSPDVRLIEPQCYRTSLTLQLHAAAV
jgi:UDP-N-acetylglucosamine 2-epimerase